MRYITKKKNLAFTVMTGSGLQTVTFRNGKFPAAEAPEISDPQLANAIESHRFYGKIFTRDGEQVVNRQGMTASQLDAIRDAAKQAMAEVEQPEPAAATVELPSSTEIKRLKKDETSELMTKLGIDHDPTLRIQVLKKQLREWIAENG